MTRPRAADDFDFIGARLRELAEERDCRCDWLTLDDGQRTRIAHWACPTHGDPNAVLPALAAEGYRVS